VTCRLCASPGLSRRVPGLGAPRGDGDETHLRVVTLWYPKGSAEAVRRRAKGRWRLMAPQRPRWWSGDQPEFTIIKMLIVIAIGLAAAVAELSQITRHITGGQTEVYPGDRSVDVSTLGTTGGPTVSIP